MREGTPRRPHLALTGTPFNATHRMPDITSRLEANRSAVDELLAVAEKSAAQWTTPTRPGKWSPSQLVEHVARSLEGSGNAFSGKASGFPSLPAIVRPLLRTLLFNRVLSRGRFPKARTNKAMNPLEGQGTFEEGRARLLAASDHFERECMAAAKMSPTLISSTFGRVRSEDHVRFMELHTRHHCKQLPGAQAPETNSARG